MKKIVLAALLFLAAPALASAAVTSGAVTVSPDPAEEGQQITVTVTAVRSGSACDNNWGYTRILVDGVQIGVTNLNAFTGTGTTTDTFTFNASGVGSHTLEAKARSGAEDFSPQDGNPDCSDTLLFNAVSSFDVVAPAPVSSGPSAPVQSGPSGGGGYSPCFIYERMFNGQCNQAFLDAWIFNQDFRSAIVQMWMQKLGLF